MTDDAPADQPGPGHAAIIMDGNGRWAKARGRPRSFGHKRGVETVRQIVEDAGDLGVRYLTLFSFSTENWNRPADEVGALFELLKHYVEADLEGLARRGVRIRIVGRRDNLGSDLTAIIERAEDRTRDNDAFHLTIAFNYGGRDEILRTCQAIAREAADGRLDPDTLDEATLGTHLDTVGLPDVDLMIRTSGEQRISNFLLWQAAYAELVFLDVLWPDFSRQDLARAIDLYRQRSRRYGGVDAGAA
ncbi:UDP pyrophosphate synthase [Maricaulis sp. W15]|uniref:isoprenyl transferase n=1 Tax=Maricaulis sp. W15 TaxID=1772333 RepID=UPI000948B1F1|nr:isoprenyl transferase [Maricaulis sp. W15]OLF77912.1 UDP pyrophosphate synthase [Maricaulis sp. W15]